MPRKELGLHNLIGKALGKVWLHGGLLGWIELTAMRCINGVPDPGISTSSIRFRPHLVTAEHIISFATEAGYDESRAECSADVAMALESAGHVNEAYV